MRLNKYIALSTGHSRRNADRLISEGKVSINGRVAELGDQMVEGDKIEILGHQAQPQQLTTIQLNKPIGYVCSRNGQGSATVYDLLPHELHHLKPVGRLDKDSSGLLLMTNDGKLANELTHPKYKKQKVYQIELNATLPSRDKAKIEHGIELADGVSRLQLTGEGKHWHVTMSEGRNRQIRRTFEALGYKVKKLHRIKFGSYQLDNLPLGKFSSTPQSHPNNPKRLA